MKKKIVSIVRNEPKPFKTFSERVLEIALSIPKGKVTTYGHIARAAGGGNMASQSITGILAKAWRAGSKKIPFHRIVYANGKVWINDEYYKERMKKYKTEKIKVNEKGIIVNFRDILMEFN